MINILLENFKQTTDKAFLQTGFRPFFLGATLYAIWVIVFWVANYVLAWQVPFYKVAAMQWHAHEMIYGYLLAVIAGFLLTAVRNWTRIQTADGNKLLSLFVFWMIARIPPVHIVLAYSQAVADLAFIGLLIYSIFIPIYKRKMTRQWPVIIILSLLFVANLIYYGAVFGYIQSGIHYGLYSGFYLIFSLVAVFSRRLIPNFIRSGIKADFIPKDRKWLDLLVLPSIILYALSVVFFYQAEVITIVSLIIVALNIIRLRDWYHSEIWSRPLLWSLWSSYAFITFGFILQVAAYFFDISPYLIIHCFSIGAMTFVTLSMMIRVSLGHTGRNVLLQSLWFKWVFVFLLLVFLFRVVLPMFDISNYRQWLVMAMVCWVIAFSLFVYHFFPILTTKKEGGGYG